LLFFAMVTLLLERTKLALRVAPKKSAVIYRSFAPVARARPRRNGLEPRSSPASPSLRRESRSASAERWSRSLGLRRLAWLGAQTFAKVL
jgi:hypothetical protein